MDNAQTGGAPTPPPDYIPVVQGESVPPPPYIASQQPSAISPSVSQPTSRRYAVPAGIGIGLLLLFLVAGSFLFGKELERFFSVGVQFFPFAVLAMLAYGGAKNGVAAAFSYVWLALLALAVLAINAMLVLSSFITGNINSVQTRSDPSAIFKPGLVSALLWTMLLLGLVSLISAAMLLRPVRVAVSRIMPIDPDNFVHKIALPILTLILLSSFVPLIVLGGKPPLLEIINNGALQARGDASLSGTPQSAGDTTSLSVTPLDLIYQFMWMVPVAFLCGGLFIARNFRATLARLGVVRPTLMQIGFGVLAGVVLAAAATYGLDPAITGLWQAMGWPTTDVAAFNQLLSGVVTPLGAVLIGVTAGVGEELAVRGLLQPRIGLIASNLVFTAFHALQYGPDALLSVFTIGLILGVIRSRSNTPTSAIVHGVYNFVLVMGAVLAG